MKNTLCALVVFALCFPVICSAQCKELRKKTDKFKDEVRIWTPILEPVSVIKYNVADSVYYYLSLAAPSNLNGTRKGVRLLLENGQRLEWPDEEVEINVSKSPRFHSDYMAKAFVSVTPDQVLLLSQTRITDYQLYIYDWSMKQNLGEVLRKQIECLANVDPASVKER